MLADIEEDFNELSKLSKKILNKNSGLEKAINNRQLSPVYQDVVSDTVRQNYRDDENINMNSSLVPESEQYSEIDPNIIKSMRASDKNNFRQFMNTDESVNFEDPVGEIQPLVRNESHKGMGEKSLSNRRLGN